MGIEPTCEAWKASALPLSYTRKTGRSGEIRTRDPLVPNQVRYRCATPRCARLSIAHGGSGPQRPDVVVESVKQVWVGGEGAEVSRLWQILVC